MEEQFRQNVSNPVYFEDENQQKQIKADLDEMIYEGPDEMLQNPLYFGANKKPQDEKIKIVIAVLQGVIMLVVAITLLLAIVILVKPYVIETTCTSGALTGSDGRGGVAANCSMAAKNIADTLAARLPSLSQDDVNALLNALNGIITNNKPPACVLPSSDETARKLAGIVNMTTNNNDVRNTLWDGVSQLLQLTNDLSTSIAYIQGLGDDQAVLNQNQSDKLDYIIQSIQNASDALTVAVGSLSTLQSTTTSTAGVANDILLITEDILDLTNRSYLLNYVNLVSCNDILRLHPNSSSGYYHLNSRTVYCEMEPLCGSAGWTRIAYFDAKTESCPSGFRTYASGSHRACGRNSRHSASCSPSITVETNNIAYTQICGKVSGYQYGSPDATNTGTNNINSWYMDGISITRGSPREHVWSFICGLSGVTTSINNCPCNSPLGEGTLAPYIGSNYFCESGNAVGGWQRYNLYTGDPLWDGQGCGSQETACCAAAGLPWFHRDYGNMSSTESIELRVCGNQGWNDEDTPLSYYEIYVK